MMDTQLHREEPTRGWTEGPFSLNSKDNDPENHDSRLSETSPGL